MYALYKGCGFGSGDIGILFVVGFGSSLIFGTIVGGFADKYGRRLNCLIFALLYGLSCVTKHSCDFTILLIGRLLGGVATSILMSAFETWMIHEHRTVRALARASCGRALPKRRGVALRWEQLGRRRKIIAAISLMRGEQRWLYRAEWSCLCAPRQRAAGGGNNNWRWTALMSAA